MKRLFVILACCFASHIYAQDGTLEINQLCISTGCFAGDSPGLPISITNPGSYRFTSNITITSATNVIQISADNVTLDLGGFTLGGGVTCTATLPITCTGPTSGRLISNSGLTRNLLIRNGNVRGSGEDGININSRSGTLITGINASENRGDGIFCAQICRIIGNSSSLNGENGINSITSSGVLVLDNQVSLNGEMGILNGICGGNILRFNEVGQESCNAEISTNFCAGSTTC